MIFLFVIDKRPPLFPPSMKIKIDFEGLGLNFSRALSPSKSRLQKPSVKRNFSSGKSAKYLNAIRKVDDGRSFERDSYLFRITDSSLQIESKDGLYLSVSAIVKSGVLYNDDGIVSSIGFFNSSSEEPMALTTDIQVYRVKNASKTGEFDHGWPFYSKNLTKETVFGFYVPSDWHVVGNISLGKLNLCLFSNFVQDARVFHHFLLKLFPPVPFGRREKNELAEISCSQQYANYQQPVKWSIRASLNQVTVELPQIRARHLQISVGMLHVFSGDYRSEVKSCISLSLVSELFKIKEKLESYVNPLCYDFVVYLKDLSLLFIDEQGLKTHILEPVSIVSQIYISSLPCNLQFCQLCYSLIMSPALVSIDAQVFFIFFL